MIIIFEELPEVRINITEMNHIVQVIGRRKMKDGSVKTVWVNRTYHPSVGQCLASMLRYYVEAEDTEKTFEGYMDFVLDMEDKFRKMKVVED